MKPTRERNHTIAYLKGLALLGIMWIHLIDWSNFELTQTEKLFRELLYPSVLFFIALAGSLIAMVYGNYPDLQKAALRLLRRGAELIGVYFAYSLIKYFIYNFQHEPFYTFFEPITAWDLLTLKKFVTSLSILLTIGIFLMISPAIIWLHKKSQWSVPILILVMVLLNYVIPLPTNALTNFLYAKDNVMFPLALWFLPFLIGFFIGEHGFEKRKWWWFGIFAVLAIVSVIFQLNSHLAWILTPSMYPLQLHYILVSFFSLSILIVLMEWIRTRSWTWSRTPLHILEILGDHTLSIYVYHWLTIDLTLWAFFPHVKLVWLTVPLFLASFVFYKFKKSLAPTV